MLMLEPASDASTAPICPTGAILSTDPSKRWAASHIPKPEACVYCGQCLINCPARAVYERVSFIEPVKATFSNPNVTTMVMSASSVRYALGEEFGLTDGAFVGGKMFAAFRKLGFDIVWDVEFGADVTIMEKGTVLLGQISGELKRPLPPFHFLLSGLAAVCGNVLSRVHPQSLEHEDFHSDTCGVRQDPGGLNRSVPTRRTYTRLRLCLVFPNKYLVL